MANLRQTQRRVDTLKHSKSASEFHSVVDSFRRAGRLAPFVLLPSIRHTDRFQARRQS